MKIRNNTRLFLVSSVLASLLLSCTMGGSTEQGNARICGRIFPAPYPDFKIEVHLVNEQFNPYDTSRGAVYRTITDTLGNYIFSEIPYGTYFLYAFDDEDRNILLRGPFEITAEQKDLNLDSLKRSSRITLSSTHSSITTADLFYIKGTSKANFTKSESVNTINNSPAGNIDILQYRPYTSPQSRIISFAKNVAIIPGDTVTVSFNNRPPRVSAFPQYMELICDSVVEFQLKATDPDGDTIFYSLQYPSLNSYSLDSTTGIFKWIPQVSEEQLRQISFLISDSRGGSSLFTWNFSFKEIVTPTPVFVNAPDTCAFDSTCRIIVSTTSCVKNMPSYRIAWGNGDTSEWMSSETFMYSWDISNTYTIRAQAMCDDFGSPSQWSEPETVIVINRVTETPTRSITTDTMNYGEVYYLPQCQSTCSKSIYFQLYCDGTLFSTTWFVIGKVSFSPQTPGIFSLQEVAWCDTSNTLPSEKSAPLTIIVRSPQPVLQTSETFQNVNDTVAIKLFVTSGPALEEKITPMHRFLIYGKSDLTYLGFLICNRYNCDSKSENCYDTIKLPNNNPTAWFDGTPEVLYFIKSQSPQYSIQVQIDYSIYSQPSLWSEEKIIKSVQ